MSLQRAILHVAGVPGADGILRCTRCHLALQDLRTLPTDSLVTRPPVSVYPEGAAIETGPGWQAIFLGDATHVAPCAPLVDALIYASYRTQRGLYPQVAYTRWARVFANVEDLEARFLNETIDWRQL